MVGLDPNGGNPNDEHIWIDRHPGCGERAGSRIELALESFAMVDIEGTAFDAARRNQTALRQAYEQVHRPQDGRALLLRIPSMCKAAGSQRVFPGPPRSGSGAGTASPLCLTNPAPSSGDGRVFAGCLPTPWQEFIEPRDWVIGQHVSQPGARVHFTTAVGKGLIIPWFRQRKLSSDIRFIP
jgi:hypothetical protein